MEKIGRSNSGDSMGPSSGSERNSPTMPQNTVEGHFEDYKSTPEYKKFLDRNNTITKKREETLRLHLARLSELEGGAEPIKRGEESSLRQKIEGLRELLEPHETDPNDSSIVALDFREGPGLR